MVRLAGRRQGNGIGRQMELLLYEPVNEEMKVVRCGIVAGKMMRTEEDFRWCVENYKENGI